MTPPARRLAQGGELLLVDPALPGQGARLELRLPLAEPTGHPPLLGGRPSMPGAHAPGWLEVQHT